MLAGPSVFNKNFAERRQLLSYVAQTEREFIHQRQAEGIAADTVWVAGETDTGRSLFPDASMAEQRNFREAGGRTIKCFALHLFELYGQSLIIVQ